MFSKGWKKIALLICFITTFSFVLIGFYSIRSTSWKPHEIQRGQGDDFQQYLSGRLLPRPFDEVLLHRDYTLDLEDEDVIVFLHIQKTGGTTFGRHLVKNLDLDKPCKCERFKKKCDCETKKKTLWLFSRYSTGWACGLHADWTELQNCVDKAMDKQEGIHRQRRFHYITMLRDPINRYLSEWRHVKRGATWKTARLFCNGRQATLEEVPFCYEGETWEGVSLENFLKCKYNLANNRQCRMLANLSKVNCYNSTGISEEIREKMLLESAKENLKNLSFFGLTEFQRETQNLFQHTFHIHFINDFEQYNETHSQATNPSKEEWDQIIKLNSLDIQLYQYAKDLFLQRVKTMHQELDRETLVLGGDSEENLDPPEN